VDIAALAARADNNGGPVGGTGSAGGVAEGAVAGRNGSGASVTGWLGRIGGGGGGSHEREKVVTVLVSDVEADVKDIVEVSRAVVVE